MRAGAIIAEPLVINQRLSKPQIQERFRQLLNDAGLEPAAANYPHEFSGGQRRRHCRGACPGPEPPHCIIWMSRSRPWTSPAVAQVMNLLQALPGSVRYELSPHCP